MAPARVCQEPRSLRFAFFIGGCKGGEPNNNSFQNPCNSDGTSSACQEQRWLGFLFFSLGIAKEQNRKTRFWEFPHGDDCRREKRSKIRFYLGKRGLFFACFSMVQINTSPPQAPRLCHFQCFLNRNSHKQLEATARRAIRKQSLKKKLRLRERRRPR